MATEILVTGTSGIFAGATLSSSFSGVLVSQTNAVAGDFAGDGDGNEVAFNIINHLYDKIALQTAEAAGADKVRVGTSSSLSGSTLTKTYTFTFDLNFSDVGSLNVVDE